MKGIASHAVLVAGRWPATSGGTRPGAIPAALPVSAAALLHVSAGDVLRLRDQGTNALVSFDITGVFTRRQGSGAANSYWNLSYIPASGMSTESGADHVRPPCREPGGIRDGAHHEQRVVGGAARHDRLLRQRPQPDSRGPHQPVEVAADRELPQRRSANNEPAVGAVRREQRRGRPVGAGDQRPQLLVLAIAALLAVARPLAAQREGESALLVARGATRSQLTRLTAAEAVPLSALVSIAGAVAGIWLASALASAGPLGTAGIQLRGRPGSWLTRPRRRSSSRS